MKISRRSIQVATYAALSLGVIFYATGCGSSNPVAINRHDTSTTARGTMPGAQPLDVHWNAAPAFPFAAPGYQVSGYYPTFGENGHLLAAVNRGVVLAISEDQKADVPEPYPPVSGDPGVYALQPDVAWMSASTIEASGLVGVRFHNPGGSGFAGLYMSYDLLVPSGQPFSLSDMLSNPTAGLDAIATAARSALASAYPDCAQTILQGPNSLGPTAPSYQKFALIERGLAFGFDAGQAGSEACGPMQVVVPWAVVRPLLNAEGDRLASGVEPVRQSPPPSK